MVGGRVLGVDGQLLGGHHHVTRAVDQRLAGVGDRLLSLPRLKHTHTAEHLKIVKHSHIVLA